MNLEKFTSASRNILNNAQNLAARAQNQYLMPVHILQATLEETTGVIGNLITRLSGNNELIKMLQNITQGAIDKLPKVQVEGGGSIMLASEAAKVLDSAQQIAKSNKDQFITVERLLEACLENSEVEKLLAPHNINKKNVNAAVREMRKGRSATSDNAEESFDALKRFGRDVTELASLGKLDPVIGRQEEIRRAMQVLSRRTKNNPVLIGSPGVGKTAIIEGLAQRINNRDVPDNLQNCRIFELDM